MNIHVQLTEDDVKVLILTHMIEVLGDVRLDASKVRIEVKSKHNYRAEWEPAHFRAVYDA